MPHVGVIARSPFHWHWDSIGVSEGGPTHQSIAYSCTKLLFSINLGTFFRALSNLNLVHPADPEEVLGAWKVAIQSNQGDGVADREALHECRRHLWMDRMSIFGLPFHIDYTGPANVSRFMKIERVKPEELVEEHEETLRDEVSSRVDSVEITGRAPMETDAQETRDLRRSDE